jgi:hypothetical protein
MNAPTEQHDPETDADLETGELPWDGFKDGRIQNFLGLDWAGRKLAEYERAIAENLAAFDADHARRVARLKKLQAPLAKARLFWLNAIESYAKEHRDDLLVGRAKSRELPGGLKLTWRTQKPGYRWDQSKTPAENKAALLAWAKEETEGPAGAQGLIEECPEVVLEAVKKYAATIHVGGVGNVFVPPGLEYVSPGETLTVSVGEEESK